MINFDDVAKENIKEHNQNWPKFLIFIPNTNNWRLWIEKNKFII